MLCKTTSRLLLILALTLTVTATLFAQDATPVAPNAETAIESVYLPLVQSDQQAITETEITTEAALTTTIGTAESVEAARNRCTNRGGKLQVIGLTSDQRLICFAENDPRNGAIIGRVTGLTMDTTLVGIDFRPATGELYGLGNAGGVYTLNLDNARVVLRTRLNVALSGSAFGIDFNPTVDRLRIISDNGQNLRANVDDGTTTADVALNYPAPGANPAPGITGAAYTNNDGDPNTATTLYDIDATLDQVVVQSPANSGQLAPTGKLTVDAATNIGFDIYSVIKDGSTVDVKALASLVVNGQAQFYSINLFTGKAELRGSFKAQQQVIDIAIPLSQQ